MYELKGKVTDILTPVTGTSAKGNWSKFDFVVRYEEGEYPKNVRVYDFEWHIILFNPDSLNLFHLFNLLTN